MKKITLVLTVLTIGFVSMSFINNSNDDLVKIETNNDIISEVVPDNAKAIIDNKCYGCHNSESRNTKGKKKLSFDTMDKLSIYKQIGKYEGIHKVITKGKMPPKKFLAKYPNKALTASEKEVLISWAKTKGEELAK